MNDFFNIGRSVTEDSTFPYIHLAYKNNLTNYRMISSGEVSFRTKNMEVPLFVKDFIKNNNEVLMIANIISGKVVGLTFRTIKGPKDFLTWGNNKGNFYGLGNLDKDFKYGTPIILVEGLLDCDVIKQYYNNTLAVLTSSLTKNQIATITRLTNKVILLLDNDEAGIKGANKTAGDLKGKCIVERFNQYPTLKDAGDIVKLEINHDKDLNFIEEYYRTGLSILVD